MRTVPNVSRAVTLVLQHLRREAEGYDDLAAYYAPSECYRDYGRAVSRDARRVKRCVRGLTKMRYERFVRHVAAITSPKWVYKVGLGAI